MASSCLSSADQRRRVEGTVMMTHLVSANLQASLRTFSWPGLR
jgi:hypothetical protein